jgi:hypothetical protein
MNTPSNSAEHAPSITLRDLFAVHIAAAILIAPNQPGVLRPEIEDMGKIVYRYSDAMIKAR